MQASSAGFLDSVDQNFRHAMSFLDCRQDWLNGSSSATRPIRFASVSGYAAACTASSAGAPCTVSIATGQGRHLLCLQCGCRGG